MLICPVVDANLTYCMDLSGCWSRKKSVLLFSHSYKVLGNFMQLRISGTGLPYCFGGHAFTLGQNRSKLQKSKANVYLALPNFHI
ncbi:hypothetical protein H5410_032106 [Solanum commersonii]|uniref:Uncharacterized protein n=1 Tax=Solanum commersonii TaxID=4109 RepID=A0A9J5YM10_SOLCO|nr:hypothetical protein H5410_032106 [Solanum commersonii]